MSQKHFKLTYDLRTLNVNILKRLLLTSYVNHISGVFVFELFVLNKVVIMYVSYLFEECRIFAEHI